MRRYRVTAFGQDDHAGTTPMSMRKDAGACLVAIAAAAQENFRCVTSTDTVWNIGSIAFEPGAANVVPSRATMIVEFRDISPDILDTFEETLADLVKKFEGYGGATAELEHLTASAPIEMDASLGTRIADAAARRRQKTLSLASGAGHDAMIMARAARSVMMFVPSIGGRSHSVEEDTREEDIIIGCQVVCDAIRDFLESGETQ